MMTGHDSTVVLPAELIDYIIDFLHDDKVVLGTCSVVSRAWMPSARYHLFHTVTIRGDRLNDRIESFFQFLESASTLVGSIKTLCLSGRPSQQLATDTTLSVRRYGRIGPHVLVSVLSKLDTLCTLVLEDILWDIGLMEGAEHIIPWSLSPTKSIRRLELRNLVCASDFDSQLSSPSNGILDILRPFSDLKELDISGIEFDMGLSPTSLDLVDLDAPLTLELESLSIKNSYWSSSFVEVVRKTQSINTLHSFTIELRRLLDARMIGGFIQDISPRPRHLDIILSRYRGYVHAMDVMQAFEISSCTSLQSFGLSISLHHRWFRTFVHESSSGWPYLLSALNALSHTVRTITIWVELEVSHEPQSDSHIMSKALENIEDTNWEPILQAMHKFQEPPSVTIVADSLVGNIGSEFACQVKGVLTQKLKPLIATGVLHINLQ